MYISKLWTCMTRHNLIDLNPNKLHYYLFMVTLDKSNESCDTLDDPSGRIFFLYKRYRFKCIWNDNKSKLIKKLTKHTCRVVNVSLMAENVI